MNQLGQLLAEIQRDAAMLPVGKLRTEIQVSLDVLAAFLSAFQDMRPDAVSLDEMIDAEADVVTAALITALFVRELSTRPAPRFARVRLSFN
jgi:hypothetical protein